MFNIPITFNNVHAGKLQFQDAAIQRLSKLRPGSICINQHDGAARREVEDFIEGIYAKTYGALIASHYPTVISVRDVEGRILAALGFRGAAAGDVYLEHYMNMPVESGVSMAFQKPVIRKSIAEVGNLASAGHGAAVFLFIALMAYLDATGYTHLVLTGTRVLRGYFSKLGLDPRDMGPADPLRLPDHGKSWGTYYDTLPRLIAGDVRASLQQLRQVMLVEQVCTSGQYQAHMHTV